MSEEERAAAYRLQYARRKAFQGAQDDALAGDDDALAALTERWQPMIDFVKEGPDVGERDEPESEGGQRIN